MDAGALLLEARVLAGLTQRQVAARAGTSASAVAQYERAAKSPTIGTLNRLLAACGFEVPGRLEVLREPVELLLRTLLSGPPDLTAHDFLMGRFCQSLDTTEVDWAFDGATALALQGLAAEPAYPGIVAADSEPLRSWLRRIGAQGWDRRGFRMAPSWDEADISSYVRHPVWALCGFVELRFVEHLTGVLKLETEVDGRSRTVPVLGLIAVEQAHDQWREVLGRLRHEQRAARLGLTPGQPP